MAADVEVANLVANIRIEAGGVEETLEQLIHTFNKMEIAYGNMASAAQKAMQEAARAGDAAATAYSQTLVPAIGKGTTALNELASTQKEAGQGFAGLLLGAAEDANLVSDTLKIVTEAFGKSETSWGKMLPGLAGMAVGAIELAVAAIAFYNAKQEEARRQTAENVKTLTSEVEGLKAVRDEYVQLKAATNPTEEQKTRMLEIERALVEQYGLLATGINAEGKAYANSAPAIDGWIERKERQLAIERELDNLNKIKAYDNDKKAVEAAKQRMDALVNEQKIALAGGEAYKILSAAVDDMVKKTGAPDKETLFGEGTLDALGELSAAYMDAFQQILDTVEGGRELLVREFGITSDNVEGALQAIAHSLASGKQGISDGGRPFAEVFQALSEAGSLEGDNRYQEGWLNAEKGWNDASMKLSEDIAAMADLVANAARQSGAEIDATMMAFGIGLAESIAKGSDLSGDELSTRLKQILTPVFDGLDLSAFQDQVSQAFKDNAGIDGILDDTEATNFTDRLALIRQAAIDTFAAIAKGAGMPTDALDAGQQAILSMLSACSAELQTASVVMQERGDAAFGKAGQSAAQTFNEAFKLGMAEQEPPSFEAFAAPLLDGGMPAIIGESLKGPQLSAPALAEDFSNADEVLGSLLASLDAVGGKLASGMESPGLDRMQETALLAVKELANIPGALTPTKKKLAELTYEYGNQERKVRALGKNLSVFTEYKKGVEGLAKAGKSQLTPELQKLGAGIGLVGSSLKDGQSNVARFESEAMAAAGSMDSLRSELIATAGQAVIDGEISVDTAQAIIDILNASGTVEEFLQKAKEAGIEIGSGKGRGGGGGKSKKEKAAEEAARAAEEAARAAEEARRKQLDAEIKAIERRRDENEITTKQEIAAYEQLMRKYQQYGDLREQIEDRIYEARRRLREEEISNLDRHNGGILTALRNRYDAQRKIEEDALQASADGWKQWADESVKAIQAQIDALDELNKTEDREAQDAKELRKIEATKQLIAFELDDYNKGQLEKELVKLEEARAERLRKQDIEDQKSELQRQIEAVQERAQAEQDAIAKQQEELAAIYDERTQEAALRAEAERMLMQSSQNELLALLNSYAPDYEATGQSLGERLYAGLQKAMGDVTDWFAAFNERILGLQKQAADSALAAADAYYEATNRTAVNAVPEAVTTSPAVTTIAPTYNFYEPVDSPSDTARRIEQTNLDLADRVNV